VREYLL